MKRQKKMSKKQKKKVFIIIGIVLTLLIFGAFLYFFSSSSQTALIQGSGETSESGLSQQSKPAAEPMPTLEVTEKSISGVVLNI